MAEKKSKIQKLNELYDSMNVNKNNETFFAIYKKEGERKTNFYFNGDEKQLSYIFMQMFIDGFEEVERGNATKTCDAILNAIAFILGTGKGKKYAECMKNTLIKVAAHAEETCKKEWQKEEKKEAKNQARIIDELIKVGELLESALKEIGGDLGKDFENWKKEFESLKNKASNHSNNKKNPNKEKKDNGN